MKETFGPPLTECHGGREGIGFCTGGLTVTRYKVLYHGRTSSYGLPPQHCGVRTVPVAVVQPNNGVYLLGLVFRLWKPFYTKIAPLKNGHLTTIWLWMLGIKYKVNWVKHHDLRGLRCTFEGQFAMVLIRFLHNQIFSLLQESSIRDY